MVHQKIISDHESQSLYYEGRLEPPKKSSHTFFLVQSAEIGEHFFNLDESRSFVSVFVQAKFHYFNKRLISSLWNLDLIVSVPNSSSQLLRREMLVEIRNLSCDHFP